MNQEIRQLALQGLYLPVKDGDYCMMGPDGRLTDGYVANCSIKDYESQRAKGYRFFPDEQTRTEYLQVGEGAWTGKMGDDVWLVLYGEDYRIQYHSKIAYDYPPKIQHWQFPSEEQALAFIAKRKVEEPKEEPTVTQWDYSKGNPWDSDASLSEVTQKIADALAEPILPKPQTITICISDEAIERTIQALHGREIGAGEMQDLKRDAKIFVALLHLEATLNS